MNKQLPKVESELAEEMTAYARSHGEAFLVGGVPYDDFIQHQLEEYERTQTAERENKKAIRKKTAVHETM